MPLCASCGTTVDAGLCAKCGTTAVPALNDNVARALCYLLGFITGIVFLNLEPYSKRPSIRFHAFQSIFFSVGWIALSFALITILLTLESAIQLWFIFLPLRLLIGFTGLVLWLFCMYKAYTEESYQLPVVGEFALKEATRN
jgi:uncharacterized membrane protein